MKNLSSYFVVGISLLFFYCGKKTVEPIQEAICFYKNNLSNTLKLEIYNRYTTSSIVYELKNGESISFYNIGDRAFPFIGSNDGPSADTVIIRFDDNKCTTYSLDLSEGTYGGDGVFDMKEYDNYSSDIVQQNNYVLFYTIDSTDYKKSTVCEN